MGRVAIVTTWSSVCEHVLTATTTCTIADFKAVRGSQMLFECVPCYAGKDCISGCKARSRIAKTTSAATPPKPAVVKKVVQKANTASIANTASSLQQQMMCKVACLGQLKVRVFLCCSCVSFHVRHVPV